MGYIRHHAIAVTTWDDDQLNAAHLKAKELFQDLVSGIVPSGMNGYMSFFIAPDGSKEGWDVSNTGNENRRLFIEWMDSQSFFDGSNSLRYCEFYYGDDEDHSGVESHN